MKNIHKIRSEILLQTLSLFADRYAKAVSMETLTAGLPLSPDTENCLELKMDYSQN